MCFTHEGTETKEFFLNYNELLRFEKQQWFVFLKLEFHLRAAKWNVYIFIASIETLSSEIQRLT